MYLLDVCDRPGCSKLHKVIATRPARHLGADALTGSHGPIPRVREDTVSLPLPVASGDVDTHTGMPARVRRAR